MKGSVLRKRYILIHSEYGINGIDKYLYNHYSVKRKYKNNNFAIFMCNQFNKDIIIKMLEKKGYGVIYVSGTIKKCKKIMNAFIEKNILQ